jgi:hypothetical protein
MVSMIRIVLGRYSTYYLCTYLPPNISYIEWYGTYLPSSIGHPPHSSASPVELRLRVGPRALSGKKKELR